MNITIKQLNQNTNNYTILFSRNISTNKSSFYLANTTYKVVVEKFGYFFVEKTVILDRDINLTIKLLKLDLTSNNKSSNLNNHSKQSTNPLRKTSNNLITILNSSITNDILNVFFKSFIRHKFYLKINLQSKRFYCFFVQK